MTTGMGEKGPGPLCADLQDTREHLLASSTTLGREGLKSHVCLNDFEMLPGGRERANPMEPLRLALLEGRAQAGIWDKDPRRQCTTLHFTYSSPTWGSWEVNPLLTQVRR